MHCFIQHWEVFVRRITKLYSAFFRDSRLGLSGRRTVALARWVTTETAGYDQMRESSHRLVAFSTEQDKSISAAQPMVARGT